ncbi:potassium-transporting ATPase subunit KdpC [Georgenia sp. 311]|uniref:Potassium-transporting ATPase KdpC subunit n=1 Tax=Georgenia wutianyii TaxID=2585135 RepID=A0ABX5VMN7_9MICO|nr:MULTISPECIES: potassium-transporting ATPase subunit KdpC [Georgenia]QDB79056.1 potassium-transporting ATPase subunit KdpC [Georgenia wutianyii]TNC17306.1 potassium-transporting ATPase subunit KdpC [Georgenia sp. 311]
MTTTQSRRRTGAAATTTTLLRHCSAGLRVLLVLTAVLGIAYPLAVTGVAQVLLPWQANGSLLTATGQRTLSAEAAVGSALVGQPFTGPEWFHPRPSAAGEGHDTLASGGSNLGPLNPDLLRTVVERRETLASREGVPAGTVPPDAVTASASGLDPHVSPEYAELQVARVAAARGLTLEQVRGLVAEHSAGRDLGILGAPRVNVLTLNLALATMGR